MTQAVIFDCEFLTAEGAPRRFWCGPRDPDPTIVQIGAVRLDLNAPFQIAETASILIRPVDRNGQAVTLDPLFVRLTGLTQTLVDAEGVALGDALNAFERFAQGATCWSWGKDEMNMIAVSCYVAGLAPPIPVTRFRNACHLLLSAGMPLADLQTTMSTGLCAYHDLPDPPGRAHDALYDATSVAHVLQHHLVAGRLSQVDFAHPQA